MRGFFGCAFLLSKRRSNKNVEVSYTVSLIGTKEKAATFRQWLCRSADYGYLFDSEQPDHFCYLLNDKIQFTEWPTLRRGTSTIEWIGNVRSLYIAPNWRTL